MTDETKNPQDSRQLARDYVAEAQQSAIDAQRAALDAFKKPCEHGVPAEDSLGVPAEE